jgi:hypothetical protein
MKTGTRFVDINGNRMKRYRLEDENTNVAGAIYLSDVDGLVEPGFITSYAACAGGIILEGE